MKVPNSQELAGRVDVALTTFPMLNLGVKGKAERSVKPREMAAMAARTVVILLAMVDRRIATHVTEHGMTTCLNQEKYN